MEHEPASEGKPRMPTGITGFDEIADGGNPERGFGDGVFVTPMLVEVQPRPERRAPGSLRDRQVLLAVLGVDEAPRE